MSAALPRATNQDVLNAPPHKVAQIVNGVLHVHPRPALPHAAAAGALNFNIGPPFGFGRGGPGGWFLIGTLTDDMPVSLPPCEAITFDLGDLWYAPE